MLRIHNGLICALLVIITLGTAVSIKLNGEDINFDLDPTTKGIKLTASTGNISKVVGTLGFSQDYSKINCIGEPICQLNDGYTLQTTLERDGLRIIWKAPNTTGAFQDCFELEDGVEWYGGPQRRVQSWPIQKLKISGDLPYVLRRDDNSGVAERYWLNSKGAYIYINSKVPLFVDQNVKHKNKVCFIAKLAGPYVNREQYFLDYNIVLKNDPKEAHLHAINTYLGKPTGHPHDGMITEPIWTTWAKYKKEINDKTVIEFANNIRNHGYKKGQLEIDDNWETCYGAQEFSTTTFPDIGNTVLELKKLNFRVTLWVHPFVNSDCQDNANIGLKEGYFLKDNKENATGSWWDGNTAYQIDFTYDKAAKWWSSRLSKLQEHPGIDSFKFDAGESDYAPQPSNFIHADIEDTPDILSERYLRTCAKFGSLIEVRSASRTQDLPIFVRMLDKDSNWGEDNGLYTLITTLFQLNLNGYTMVLPDMIGGNGYNGMIPDAELLVRWAQANTFMPAMQFSYLPWEITNDTFDAPKIVQKFVELHEKYAPNIIKAMERSVKKGSPVNPPIWWIDPTDKKALACDDEYLVGEEILVAPVIKQGATSRNVYLPKGEWTDGNNGKTYKGPMTLKDYPAGIEILPYFFLKS